MSLHEADQHLVRPIGIEPTLLPERDVPRPHLRYASGSMSVMIDRSAGLRRLLRCSIIRATDAVSTLRGIWRATTAFSKLMLMPVTTHCSSRSERQHR